MPSDDSQYSQDLWPVGNTATISSKSRQFQVQLLVGSGPHHPALFERLDTASRLHKLGRGRSESPVAGPFYWHYARTAATDPPLLLFAQSVNKSSNINRKTNHDIMNTTISFYPDGTAQCLWTEALPLHEIGRLEIHRATNLEFNNTTQQQELKDRRGRVRFIAKSRSACLEWEQQNLQPD